MRRNRRRVNRMALDYRTVARHDAEQRLLSFDIEHGVSGSNRKRKGKPINSIQQNGLLKWKADVR